MESASSKSMSDNRSNTVISGLWVGDVLPIIQQLSIQSFLANGFDFHLYTYREYPNVPSGTVVCDASTVIPQEEYAAYFHRTTFSDVFRFKLLLDSENCWVDLDMVCLRRFDLSARYVISSELTKTGRIKANMGLIKVPGSAPLIRDCHQKAAAISPSDTRFGNAGINIFDRLIASHDLQRYVLPPEVFCPIPWWEYRQAFNSASCCLLERTVAVHLWHEMIRQEMPETAWMTDRPRTIKSGSLLDRLFSAYLR